MTDILKRVEENKKRLRPKLMEELAKKPLSRMLRRESWPDHERAQYSPFELALAGGTIPRDAYADLLAQVYPVYIALEEREAELAGDPIASLVFFDELHRSSGVAKDLDYFWPEWRTESKLLPVTVEYVARVRNADPIQFVAHHYNRYLADLSGGLMIAAALKRAWDMNGEGLAYYDFPEIPDAMAWKDNYRARMDALPLDIEQKMYLIGEVMAAYEYNIEMADVLAATYLEDPNLEPAGA
ncbi:MAG: heme oxygenase (biliverdin-producing) [Actinomycetota bacterium]|nr:biliverdin-producing heme oxygenase [Actinomycetota bacterium]